MRQRLNRGVEPIRFRSSFCWTNCKLPEVLALPLDDPIVKELRAEATRLGNGATRPVCNCGNCSS